MPASMLATIDTSNCDGMAAATLQIHNLPACFLECIIFRDFRDFIVAKIGTALLASPNWLLAFIGKSRQLALVP